MVSRPDRLARTAMAGLASAGADLVFGVPGGGPNIEMIESGAGVGMGFVLTHGEAAACIAAGTYGRLAGVPGVAVVTRGPGLASAANGVAQATLDRFPLVLLSDTIPAAHRDRIGHQKLDQTQTMAPLTKWSGRLGFDNPTEAVGKAARIALDPPAGAVHLDFDPTHPGDQPPPNLPVPTVDGEDLLKARRLVAGSRRPIFLVGAGAAPIAKEVRAVVEEAGIPALVTYQAKGVIPDDSPSYGGLFTNSAAERRLVDSADLIVAVELDPVEPMPGAWPYHSPVLALSTHPIMDSYYPATVELNGRIDSILGDLAEGLSSAWPPGAGPEQNTRFREALEAESPGFSPLELVETLIEAGPDDPVLTVDAGAHFLVIMPLWPVRRPLDLLISNGLATMGFALPAAIGAALARPDRPVMCLVGDGGLGMTMAELETVARLDLDVTVVVFNDSTLSLIDVKRDPSSPLGPGLVRYGPTDFAMAARSMGLPGHVATRPRHVREALAAGSGPRLIDARINPETYAHVIRETRG